MPKLRGKDTFKLLLRNVDHMADEIDRSLVRAAATATRTSRLKFDNSLSGRPHIDPRPGRPTTRGNFASSIQWKPSVEGPTGNSVVRVDIQAMERAYGGTGVPIWLINEIGTGSSAFMKGARGRRVTGRGNGQHRVKVKSQVGRAIPYGLVFGTGPGGAFSPPGGNPSEQLYPASTLTGVPGSPRKRIRISKEIEPKNYLRDGGTQGFRQFEQSALAAAYAAFDKRTLR